MKDHGGLALLGNYSDEEEAGDDLDAYVTKSNVGRKKRRHQEFVENDDDSSADEAENQEPEMPQAALFLGYEDDSDEENDEEEQEHRIPTSPKAEEVGADMNDSFPQRPPSPEKTFPTSPAVEIVEAAPAPSRKVKRELDDMFNLLPPAKKSCPKDLRDKVKKYMQLKDQGQSINGKISTMKSLRNPYILEDLLVRHGLDELGSNFSIERFNPKGFEASDFHEALQEAQTQMMQAQAKKSMVEFTNGVVESSTLPGPRKGSISRWDVAGPQ